MSVREALSSKKEELPKDSEADSAGDGDDAEVNFDARMHQQIIKTKKELGDMPTKKRGEKIVQCLEAMKSLRQGTHGSVDWLCTWTAA